MRLVYELNDQRADAHVSGPGDIPGWIEEMTAQHGHAFRFIGAQAVAAPPETPQEPQEALPAIQPSPLATERTRAGIQYVVPGCETNDRHLQINMFDERN